MTGSYLLLLALGAGWAIGIATWAWSRRVTGIRPAEAQALRTPADDTGDRRKTGVFQPLPPRTRSGPA